jgi:hypothetical protein
VRLDFHSRNGTGRQAKQTWTQRVQLPSPGFLLLYGTLASVTLVTVALYVLYPEHTLINDFGPEVATNALAILVTLAFVQRLLDAQERRRRLRGSIGGLRRGARALCQLQEAWASTLKGCFLSPPVERRDSTTDLFLDGRVEELMYLDPGALRRPDGEPALAWLIAEVQPARETLRAVARQYAGGFDVEYLEALEELVDDPFPDLLAELAQREVTTREWRVRINSARGARAGYFSQLLRVVELHNEIAREAGLLRGARPRTHELGIVLAADHDLRVTTEIPASWWTSSPQPGTLRQPPQAPLPRTRANV